MTDVWHEFLGGKWWTLPLAPVGFVLLAVGVVAALVLDTVLRRLGLNDGLPPVP